MSSTLRADCLLDIIIIIIIIKRMPKIYLIFITIKHVYNVCPIKWPLVATHLPLIKYIINIIYALKCKFINTHLELFLYFYDYMRKNIIFITFRVQECVCDIYTYMFSYGFLSSKLLYYITLARKIKND